MNSNGGQALPPERFEEEPVKAGSVTVQVEAHRTVVFLVGDIDADLSTELGQATVNATAPGLPIEVDMRAVSFMDSTGLTFLNSVTPRTSHRVRVVGASKAVQFLLEITGVDQSVDLA